MAQLSNALDTLKGQMAAFTTAAAKESSSYLLLAQSAQSLEVRMATATGDFSVAVPATLPTSPYKPRPLRNAILGLGVGLFVAIGLVFLLEQFDTKPRTHREVSEILGLSVVGRVPRIDSKAIAADPLAGVHNASGAAAESLRLLRSNLDYLDVDGALSTVLITSCLPGEGKSVTVCNLGVTLAMGGRRVVIIDADLRRPSVHRYMGLQNTTGLSSVVAGKVPLVEALQGYNLPPLDWSSNGDGHNGNGSEARERRRRGERRGRRRRRERRGTADRVPPRAPRRRHQREAQALRPHLGAAAAEPRRDRRLEALRSRARRAQELEDRLRPHRHAGVRLGVRRGGDRSARRRRLRAGEHGRRDAADARRGPRVPRPAPHPKARRDHRAREDHAQRLPPLLLRVRQQGVRPARPTRAGRRRRPALVLRAAEPLRRRGAGG